jgi:hypothetical protein
MRCLGFEAHPLVAELAALKFKRPASPHLLLEAAKDLVDSLDARMDISGEHPLVQKSFEANVLRDLVALRERVIRNHNDPWHLHLKWCLIGSLRDCASSRVGWPYQRPSIARIPRISNARRAFVRRAKWMAEDLGEAASFPVPDVTIVVGDARQAETWTVALRHKVADAIVTSPPYLNNFDYADATRLELYFWGVARNWAEMCSTVRSGMVVATTQQTSRARAVEAAVALQGLCPRTAETTCILTQALKVERTNRARGKEYDQVLPHYFLDLAQTLVNIRTHTVSGAPVAMVLGDSAPYGIYVDTPAILAGAAQELGYKLVSVSVLRKRGLRWHLNGTRHSIDLAEKVIILQSPGAI